MPQIIARSFVFSVYSKVFYGIINIRLESFAHKQIVINKIAIRISVTKVYGISIAVY